MVVASLGENDILHSNKCHCSSEEMNSSTEDGHGILSNIIAKVALALWRKCFAAHIVWYDYINMVKLWLNMLTFVEWELL